VALGAGTSGGLRDGSRVRVSIAGATLHATVSASAGSRAQGLAGRPRLAPGRGMLFSFPGKKRQSFWMKGMRFPIDIVWIRGGTVTGVTAGVPPPSAGTPAAELPLYESPGTVDRVLEARSGWARAHGVDAGKSVVIRRLGG
jgi:uncharacterized membrane protein (UPF0127 family)